MSENQYPLNTGRSNILGTEAFRNLLGQSLNNAKEEIIILSAFVKIKGVNWLVDKILRKKINCTIISKWDHNDIAQGASDLECYEICKKEGWQFKVLKNLHAKIILIDTKELFIGSPNLTAKGMSLTPVPNKEMGVKLEVNQNDIQIINNLVEESILIDDKIYKDFQVWKNSLPKIENPSYPEFPDELKNKLDENYEKLWVHNFPWSTAEELLNINKIDENIQHDLELFGLDKDNLDKAVIMKNIQNSKIYHWLVNQINKQQNKEIYFGNLSSIIHNSLLDDPRPYRKDVKSLQVNLYSYIRFFLKDKIKVDVPYEKSERITLIK